VNAVPVSNLTTSGPVVTQTQESKEPEKRAQALKKYLEAQRLEREGNYSGAVAALKEAIAMDPQSVELRVALGSLYLKNRNVIDAETQGREAAKVASDNLEVHKLLARIYLAQTFVGTTLVKDKARDAIKELQEIVRLNSTAKIDVGDQEQPALMVIGELYQALDEPDKALEALKKNSESNSSSDEAHYQLADLYYQKNKFRESAAEARLAYDLNLKSPDPRKSIAYARALARSLLRIGRSQEAVEVYKKAIYNQPDKADKKPVDPKNGDAGEDAKDSVLTSPLLFDYAEALVYAGKYDDAVKLLDPIVKNARKDSQFYLQAIRINVDALRRSGRRDEAVHVLEDALKGQDVSDSLPLLYSLAETYEEMQKFDKAISTYEEALGSVLNPDGTVNNREQDKQAAALLLQRIAFAQKMAGDRDKMNAIFDRMKKVLGKDNSRADQLIVDTLYNEGKYKEALDAATAAAERFPDERTFKFYRAQAAGKLGEMKTAEDALRAMLKNGPEDTEVYLVWSAVQLDANQLKEAEDSARKAIERDPRDLGPLVTLASVQDRQKKYKESEATLRKALEIDPDNATVLNNLGYFFADRNEKLPEAEALIRRAVNIEPTNGSFLDSLGWLLFRQGKTQEAQKYLEQAVIYQPRSATIHDHLGDLYKKIGQNDKARAKWEDALKLATEPEETKKIKEKLGKK